MAKPPGESRIPVFRCAKPSLGDNVIIQKHYHQHESTGPVARPQRLLGLFSSNRAKLKKVMPEDGRTSSGKSSAASSIKGSADPSPTLSEPLEDVEKSRRSSSARSVNSWSSPRATSTPVIGDNERRRPTSARSLDKFWLPKVGHEEGVTAANIGHRVCVGGQKVGILRYFGEMELGSVGGFYCGIELNEPAGLNDGSVQGVRYFTCKPQHGIFAPVGKVRPLSGSSWHTAKRRKLGLSAEEEDDIDGSGPYSLLEGLTDRGDPNEELLLGDNESQRSLRPRRSETFTIQPECVSDGSPIASAVSTTNASPRESWNYQRSGSAGSLQHHAPATQQQNELSKQSSFELDESSLGILTPDQMLDFTVCEDSPSVGRTPSFEDMGSYLLGDCGPPFASDPIDVVPNDNHVVARSDVMSLQELEQLSKDITLLENQSFPEYNVTVLECDAKSGAEDDILLEEESRRGDVSAGTPATATKSSDEGDFTPASIRGVVDISDRTLSPEDLPMDAPYQEVVLVADKTELTSESGRDTAGLSGATSAGPSSRSSAAPPLPVGFVTSVTSITSLDNGYQGDGEWSRPASRGADHSPTGGPKPRIINNPHLPLDPMTDSDFFTESDADMHEDAATTAGSDTAVQGASTGVARAGDRKAQVIDGTLYGAAPGGGVVLGSQQHQLCPAFTASSTNEEMESSGVYSDLERRPEETNSDLGGKEEEEEEVLATPEGSTKTVSSHSDQSQVVAENNLKNQTMSIVDNTEDNTLTPVAPTQPSISPGTNNKTPTHSSSPAVTKHTKEESGSTQPLKKYKMPKRNVGSKIKAMIESSASPAARDDENQENRRPGKPARKFGGGRWDAVMSKIEQGKADDKLKPSRLKEVKSKVLASISSCPPPPRKTSNTNISKTRRGRSRASPAAQQQSGTGVGVTANSATSSQHSSLSDVSQTCNSVASTSKAVASLRTPKKQQQQQQQQQQQRDVGRSTSPLSDGSTNSTASHHLLARSSSSNHLPPLTHPVVMRTTAAQQTRDAIPPRERVLRDKRSDNNRNNISATNTTSSKHRTSRTLPSSATSGSKGKLLQTRKATAATEEKNGVSVTPSADMKTQTVRKQTSRRGTPTSVSQKPTPLRDHNRQPPQQQQQQTGGGVLKEAAAPPSKQSRALPQPTPAELLLPQLRHSSAGFEALGILVQYLVYNLDAFATPQLKKQLDTMKTEWLKTKLELEEVQVSYRRVEDCLAEEKVLHRQKLEELVAAHCRELTAHDAKHSKEMAELVSRHEAQITEYEKRFQEQLEEMKGRYEGELCKKEREHKEKLEGTISEWQIKLEQLKHDHDVALAHQQADAASRENELNRRLAVVEEEYSGLKDQSRRLLDSMQKDKDTKLQATAGRCRELQEEVDSLRSVLDLRHKELQELRLHNAKLTREAEELPVAQQRVAALEAKVEDLQVQLQRKTDAERQIAHEYRMMVETLDQESKQNKRLSLHNEELQWKLKQNSQVVNVLAALSQASMNSSPLATTLNVAAASGRRSNHGSAQSLNENPARPVSASSRTNLGEETSPPSSPKVKAVIEKSDSVSWVLEMDETSDMVVSRLVRRAGSFRGATPPPSSSSSPAHARTLPPPKRQRCKASSLSLSTSSSAISRPASSGPIRNTALSSSLRARSRSVSTDGGETEYSNWKPEMSTPHRHSTGMQHNESFESEDDMMMLVNGGKRCSEDDNEDAASLLIHGANTNLMKRLAASEGSNDEDSPSKSAGSSGSSEAGSRKDSCHQSRKQQVSDNLTDPSANSDSLDLGDTEVLPLPPLPGSTSGDLSLLAAQPLPPMLKESGGEAMISEETSEDENDNEEVNSSSEEQSCSDDETTSSESSSDLGHMGKEGKKLGNSSENKHEDFRDGRALQKRESSGQQNLAASTGSMQQYHLLMMSDNGSYSTTTTTMDISWSEDMELMPSESEG